jgi:hypothetical protein
VRFTFGPGRGVEVGLEVQAEDRTAALTKCCADGDAANCRGCQKRTGEHDGASSRADHGCENRHVALRMRLKELAA